MATTPVQLWSCKWAWCRETLTAKDDLLRHILITHVATAEKVKKKDVPLILRAEQGLSGTGVVSHHPQSRLDSFNLCT